MPVVGIGASAGGIEALSVLLQALPENLGVALVVTHYLDPHAPSDLAKILGARSHMPVVQVGDNSELRPNQVYVIPPDRRLQISDHTISAVPFDEPRGQRAPIDLFFRSLADQHGDGFAVILTGAGADGAVGRQGGQGSRRHHPGAGPGRGRISLDAAQRDRDRKWPISSCRSASLPTRLAELIRDQEPIVAGARRGRTRKTVCAASWPICGCAPGTISPNTSAPPCMRRAAAAHAGRPRKDDFEDYFAYLRDNAEEAQALLGRPADLGDDVLPRSRGLRGAGRQGDPASVPRQRARRPVRVWVPGCATGEEAYSHRHAAARGSARQHDVRPRSRCSAPTSMRARWHRARGPLSGRHRGRCAARSGCAASSRREGDHYRVRRELRDIVLFADHSLLKDPPFSRLDLISCRNLLIYLDRELQQQVCSTFHYALNPGRLSVPRLVGDGRPSGRPVPRRRPRGAHLSVDRPLAAATSRAAAAASRRFAARASGIPPRRLAGQQPQRAARPLHREALENVAPPSMLVDESHRVLHLSENAGRYLQPSAAR